MFKQLKKQFNKKPQCFLDVVLYYSKDKWIIEDLEQRERLRTASFMCAFNYLVSNGYLQLSYEPDNQTFSIKT